MNVIRWWREWRAFWKLLKEVENSMNRMNMRIWLTLALISMSAAASAQTAPVAEFNASPDHSIVVGATPVVSGYQLDVMLGTVTGALSFTKSLGKPTPDASNLIRVPLPEFLTKANGIYVATVSATGPGGTTRSVPSDPFSWMTVPAPAGKPAIRYPVP